MFRGGSGTKNIQRRGAPVKYQEGAKTLKFLTVQNEFMRHPKNIQECHSKSKILRGWRWRLGKNKNVKGGSEIFHSTPLKIVNGIVLTRIIDQFCIETWKEKICRRVKNEMIHKWNCNKHENVEKKERKKSGMKMFFNIIKVAFEQINIWNLNPCLTVHNDSSVHRLLNISGKSWELPAFVLHFSFAHLVVPCENCEFCRT